ncbi:MAG: tetratricopeptide repeat protein [Pseudomonadota bacterium]
MHDTEMPARAWVFMLIGLLASTAAAYWPGLRGPWLFDDFPNIIENPFIRLAGLDVAAMARAAFDGQGAGPLGRPLAYLTLALDYYRADGTTTAFLFKVTNLVIHAINVALVWLLARVVARRLPRLSHPPAFALAVAALFALHPIMLSSVLYVVQRMTSLAATFSLAALLCWLRARECTAPFAVQAAATSAQLAASAASRVDIGARAAAWLLAGGVFFVLGVFTKENAILTLPLALLLDAALFASARPWCLWERLAPRARWALLGLAAVVTVLVLATAAQHFAGGYAARSFTLAERLLTEARVIWFYLGLIYLPRIDAFGLHHDDIVLSTGWLAPWTTLPAVIGIVVLLCIGLWALRRQPLLAIGILWFLIGHSLESSFIPLEIAHEHRNYLPALGPYMLLAGAFCVIWQRAPRRQAALLAGLVVAVLTGTTTLRASQWRDDLSFSQYEVAHHPDSARARNDLASDLARVGDFAGAQREAEAAVRIDPIEVGYRINLANLVLAQGAELTADAQATIESLLTDQPLSAFGTLALKRYAACIQSRCKQLAPYLARWLDVYLAADQPKFDQSYAWYLKGLSQRAAGDAGGALNAFEKAFALDGVFLHPLFEQANIFLALGQWDNAEFNLRRLTEANRRAPVRQDKALRDLETAIAAGRTGEGAESIPGMAP